MLSVVIATQNSERELLPTLATLVPGAIAGLVREVIVADAGSRDDTPAIADAAGCRLLTSEAGRGARLRAAVDVARARWLLFLQPGAMLEPGWIDETRRFVEGTERAGPANAAVFRAAPAAFPLLDALARLGVSLGVAPNPSSALLLARAHYLALGGHRDVDDADRELIRRLGRRRLVRLRTRAMASQ